MWLRSSEYGSNLFRHRCRAAPTLRTRLYQGPDARWLGLEFHDRKSRNAVPGRLEGTRKLLNNAKERLPTSGIRSERLCTLIGTPS